MLSASIVPSGVLITNTTDPADPSPQALEVDYSTTPGSVRLSRADNIGPTLVLTLERFGALEPLLADAVLIEEGDPADWVGWTEREYDTVDNYNTSYQEPADGGAIGDGVFTISGLTSSNTWGSLSIEMGTAKGLLDHITAS